MRAMAQWRRDGVAVIAAVPGDQSDVAERLKRGSYGFVSVDGRHRVLSLEEAYYALTEDRLLETSDESTLEQIWHDFLTASAGSFRAQYVLYRHFRRHGWLLRSGLNYGAQYVLYRGDADVYHSEYIAYLQSTATGSWHGIQALTRIAADVKKTVLLCEVSLEDTPASSDDVNSDTFSQSDDTAQIATHGWHTLHGETFAVHIVMIRYWDPSTVDDNRESYDFTPQPVVHKRKPKAAKKRASKRPAREPID